MLRIGTKVKIKEGMHSLVPDTEGEIVGFAGHYENDGDVYEVKGDSAIHLNREIINDLTEDEFELVDKADYPAIMLLT
jgi:hypothetical protein